jgi:hypothetical protein
VGELTPDFFLLRWRFLTTLMTTYTTFPELLSVPCSVLLERGRRAMRTYFS